MQFLKIYLQNINYAIAYGSPESMIYAGVMMVVGAEVILLLIGGVCLVFDYGMKKYKRHVRRRNYRLNQLQRRNRARINTNPVRTIKNATTRTVTRRSSKRPKRTRYTTPEYSSTTSEEEEEESEEDELELLPTETPTKTKKTVRSNVYSRRKAVSRRSEPNRPDLL